LLGGGRKVGAGEIEGEDERFEARLVDGIEAGLADLRPGGEGAGFGVEVTIVAGEAVGEGKGEREVEVLFGLDALVANALVGEGAFGVEARKGIGVEARCTSASWMKCRPSGVSRWVVSAAASDGEMRA
jgi:hypothetical protein